MERINNYVDDQLDKYRVPIKIGYKLRVVIDEIYSNIVFYSAAASVGLDLFVKEDDLYLIFADDGIPYNPLEAEEPDVHAPAEEREVGGLGIYLVRQLMDVIEYTYEHGQNNLTLMIHLKEAS